MAKFVVRKDYTYWWRVSVSQPSSVQANAGTFTESSFHVQFQNVASGEATELLSESPSALMRKAVVGWNGIEDEDGHALEFTADNLEAIIGNSWALIGLMQAWTEAFDTKPANDA